MSNLLGTVELKFPESSPLGHLVSALLHDKQSPAQVLDYKQYSGRTYDGGQNKFWIDHATKEEVGVFMELFSEWQEPRRVRGLLKGQDWVNVKLEFLEVLKKNTTTLVPARWN